MSEPRRVGLLELLRSSQGCQFVIPVYQRNYSWTAEKDVKQYLNDLDNVIKGRYENHFLGIIIYLEKPIDFSTREYSVIDGQQRLTTTFLLIYAIKELLCEKGEIKEVERLDGQYLTNAYCADPIKYKLKPLVSDDDVYRDIVEGNISSVTDTNSKVYKNYCAIKEHLNTLLKSGYTENDILMALDKLYVVSVPISENDNAQKIFESINATGEKLTAADLIRNYLLMDLPSDIQDKYYLEYWKKFEDLVSQDSKELEMFFRMFLAIKTYELVPKNNVYREFVYWDENNGIDVKDLLEELLCYANIYYSLINEKIDNAGKELRVALEDFRKVNSDVPLCVAMEMYRLYLNDSITVNNLAGIISTINAYMIRRSICDMNSQNISKLFPTILKKVLEKCSSSFENIVNIFNQELVGNNANTSGSFMPNDKQMLELLLNANVYKRPALRIILDRLELSNNSAPVDLSALSIEHLMPQTPTDEWLCELDVDEEVYLENLHRIGNLTLATKPDNSKMKNLTWEYKNAILKDTGHLKMNMELLSIDRWNIEEIEKRSRSLISKICELYPYPDVTISERNSQDVVTKNDALNYCLEVLSKDGEITSTNPKGTYQIASRSEDGIIIFSKMYTQGDKESYWYGYRQARFDSKNAHDNQYIIFGCRSKNIRLYKIPRKFVDENLDALPYSTDDKGEISHYHIKIFIEGKNKATLLLSKPTVREIDISKFEIL